MESPLRKGSPFIHRNHIAANQVQPPCGIDHISWPSLQASSCFPDMSYPTSFLIPLFSNEPVGPVGWRRTCARSDGHADSEPRGRTSPKRASGHGLRREHAATARFTSFRSQKNKSERRLHAKNAASRSIVGDRRLGSRHGIGALRRLGRRSQLRSWPPGS